jgi:hypothetical protein
VLDAAFVGSGNTSAKGRRGSTTSVDVFALAGAADDVARPATGREPVLDRMSLTWSRRT